MERLRLRSENGEVVIEVADQGVGIDPADVPRIFDRFFRVERPENDRVPGAGLGLTLVQHIAEAHGGRVFEVDRSGRLVWNWIIETKGDGLVPEVLEGTRYPAESAGFAAGLACSD